MQAVDGTTSHDEPPPSAGLSDNVNVDVDKEVDVDDNMGDGNADIEEPCGRGTVAKCETANEPAMVPLIPLTRDCSACSRSCRLSDCMSPRLHQDRGEGE